MKSKSVHYLPPYWIIPGMTACGLSGAPIGWATREIGRVTCGKCKRTRAFRASSKAEAEKVRS